MGNIVETLEIEDGTNEIIYLIKFEQLIPRLQKYYNFEANRDILKSYDIRPQTRNFIRVMKHEVDKSLTVEKLMVVLENLSNYQWQGFSEKEETLNLSLKVFDRYNNNMHTSASDLELRAKVVEIVNQVGFPCQNIFNAHIKKLMKRYVKN